MTDSTIATAAGGVADVETIRSQFPALQRHERGRAVAYFDGPGGTQVPRGVVDAVGEYLLHHNANTHWRYPTSRETDDILLSARRAVADLLAATPEEIVFGANMTSLTFHLSRALGRGWRAGDEVIVTELDHHANVDPWKALARERDLVVRVAPMSRDTGQLDWSALAALVSPRTKLLAIGAASNALGTISDVRGAARLVHGAGGLLFVDAVHYAPHGVIDVGGMECDFLACSAYKFYGPHVGILYGRRPLLERIDVPKLAPAPDEVPERIEVGTQNHEGIAGVEAAIDFLASLASRRTDRRRAIRETLDAVHARGQALLARMWAGLAGIDGVRLYGPPIHAPRTPTVAFTVDGVTTDEVAEALADRAIFVSNGDFYAATVIERLGLEPGGVVRAGCACYTSADEVDRLVEGVREIAMGR